jgi:phospholipid-translocating ATPase
MQAERTLENDLEDARRHTLDNEVNNSAVTRLGDWANVNVPEDDRAYRNVASNAPSF